MIKKQKKSVEKKENKINIVTVAVLVTIGVLLFIYNGILTGEVSHTSFEKQLHYYMKAGNSVGFRGKIVELIGVTVDGDVVVTVDNGEPQVAWWSGCEVSEQGTWIRDDMDNGLNVRVCASSYDRQEADLDFRL